VALAVVFYEVYAHVRDVEGRATGRHATAVAFAHGRDVGRLERWLHLDIEGPVQRAVLHANWLVHAIGGFYGSAHFVVTIGVLVWLLVRHPEDYRFWRTVLALTTAAGVLIFWLDPTAPPRLIPGTGLQDTLSTVGGLWSYNHGVLEHITDPYAAMPSLHLGWSTWSAMAVGSTAGRRWGRRRWLVALYPMFVAFVVLATGAHWFLDTVAGTLLLLSVWAACRVVQGRLLRAGPDRGPSEIYLDSPRTPTVAVD